MTDNMSGGSRAVRMFESTKRWAGAAASGTWRGLKVTYKASPQIAGLAVVGTLSLVYFGWIALPIARDPEMQGAIDTLAARTTVIEQRLPFYLPKSDAAPLEARVRALEKLTSTGSTPAKKK